MAGAVQTPDVTVGRLKCHVGLNRPPGRAVNRDCPPPPGAQVAPSRWQSAGINPGGVQKQMTQGSEVGVGLGALGCGGESEVGVGVLAWGGGEGPVDTCRMR